MVGEQLREMRKDKESASSMGRGYEKTEDEENGGSLVILQDPASP